MEVVGLEITYADGSKDVASGEDAAKLWNWLNRGHKDVYIGPPFRHEPPSQMSSTVYRDKYGVNWVFEGIVID